MLIPPTTEYVRVERDGPVAILTLTYPERRNALSLVLRESLASELQTVMADPECRSLVITGDGENFCSGGDLSSFDGLTPPAGRVRMQRVQQIVRLIVRGEKPVVAAVEGHAAGAGVCLAAICDMVVASRSAKFTCSFSKIGLFPDLGGAWAIPARMGLGRGKMLMMSGRTLDADTAERQGLVDLVTEPGEALAAAISLAQDVAKLAPLSHGLVKAVLSRGPAPLEDVLSAEADAQAVLYGSEDFLEGRHAFMEKRRPAFRGR